MLRALWLWNPASLIEGSARVPRSFYMGVSEIRGTLFWGSFNKDPTI